MLYDPNWKPKTKFKTAKQLDLSQRDYKAMLDALVVMKQGFHACPIQKFDMSTWNKDSWIDDAGYHCGTVACIGGTIEEISGIRVWARGLRTCDWTSLHRLFYPNAVQDWKAITFDEGVQALENYLTCGEPKWEDIIPRERLSY